MRLNIITVLSIALIASSYAAEPKPLTVNEAKRKRLLISFVPPAYPEAAKRMFWTGRGVFELTFDYESGRLRQVHVVKSTGHGILDASAIAALKMWKAKPRSIHKLRPLPIEFKHTGG